MLPNHQKVMNMKFVRLVHRGLDAAYQKSTIFASKLTSYAKNVSKMQKKFREYSVSLAVPKGTLNLRNKWTKST